MGTGVGSTPSEWADRLTGKFRFSEIEEAKNPKLELCDVPTEPELTTMMADVKTEIAADLGEMDRILTGAGIDLSEREVALQGVFDQFPEDSDLDGEYGAAMAGVCEKVCISVISRVFATEFGQELADELVEHFVQGDYSHVKKEDLRAMGYIYGKLKAGYIRPESLLKCLKAFGNRAAGIRLDATHPDYLAIFSALADVADAKEFEAIVDHVIKMTPEGDDLNAHDLPQAIEALRKGGIGGLKRYQRELWN